VAEAKTEAQAEDKSGETREGEKCTPEVHIAKAADTARAAATTESPSGIMMT
jgi:hypothetical protein